jgi:hypothetical protein
LFTQQAAGLKLESGEGPGGVPTATGGSFIGTSSKLSKPANKYRLFDRAKPQNLEDWKMPLVINEEDFNIDNESTAVDTQEPLSMGREGTFSSLAFSGASLKGKTSTDHN